MKPFETTSAKFERPGAPERRSGLTLPQLEDRIFTVMVAGERFGIPVACVHTVFRIETLTPVPLAPPAIAGLVNLRGRIVTAVSLRSRLGLPRALGHEGLAIGIEHRGEALALVVDEAGDVVSLQEAVRIDPPRHMPPARARLTQAIFHTQEGLLCILDMAAVFDLSPEHAVAA